MDKNMPKTKAKKKTEYRQVKVPKNLVNEVDDVVGTHGYRSRQEFVADAVRRLLNVYGVPSSEK